MRMMVVSKPAVEATVRFQSAVSGLAARSKGRARNTPQLDYPIFGLVFLVCAVGPTGCSPGLMPIVTRILSL